VMGLTYEQAAAVGLGHLHPDSPTNRIAAAACPLPEPEPKPGANKYHAEPNVYRGVRYHSKAEANHARKLDDDVFRGLAAWWVRQVSVKLGEDHRTIVDFLVCDHDGYAAFHEVKGAETREWRRTRSLWRKHGPSHGPPVLLVWRKGELAETIVPDGYDERESRLNSGRNTQ